MVLLQSILATTGLGSLLFIEILLLVESLQVASLPNFQTLTKPPGYNPAKRETYSWLLGVLNVTCCYNDSQLPMTDGHKVTTDNLEFV